MTTALYTAAGLIRARFSTQITTGQSLTTIHDNVPDSAIPTTGRWCRLSLRFGEQRARTIGADAAQYQTIGVAIAQVFAPLGDGDGVVLQLADAIVTAFRGVTLAGPPVIHFDSPYLSTDPALDGALWSVNVTIPFRIEEL